MTCLEDKRTLYMNRTFTTQYCVRERSRGKPREGDMLLGKQARES